VSILVEVRLYLIFVLPGLAARIMLLNVAIPIESYAKCLPPTILDELSPNTDAPLSMGTIETLPPLVTELTWLSWSTTVNLSERPRGCPLAKSVSVIPEEFVLGSTTLTG